MNKQERLKHAIEIIKNTTFRTGRNNGKNLYVENLKFIIKQAERNEQYEQSIKLAVSHFNQDEHQEGMKILQNVLRYVEETECD